MLVKVSSEIVYLPRHASRRKSREFCYSFFFFSNVIIIITIIIVFQFGFCFCFSWYELSRRFWIVLEFKLLGRRKWKWKWKNRTGRENDGTGTRSSHQMINYIILFVVGSDFIKMRWIWYTQNKLFAFLAANLPCGWALVDDLWKILNAARNMAKIQWVKASERGKGRKGGGRETKAH